MAFTYTKGGDAIISATKRIAWGTFTNAGGSTGGDIITGLDAVDHMDLQHTGAAVVVSEPTVNESFPTSIGTMTIVTVADADGTWWAMGTIR